MDKLEITKTNALKAYKEADEKTKTVLWNLFGKETFSKKVTDRITADRPFENACIEIGEDPTEVLPYKTPLTKRQHRANDRERLDVIAEALREGVELDFSDSKPKWFAVFEYKKSLSGFGFSYSSFAFSYSFAHVGSRLSFPTEELSNHFGRITLEIQNRLLTNKY